jgi:hypothetical protein
MILNYRTVPILIHYLFVDEKITALLDPEPISLILEEVYERIISKEYPALEITTQSIILITAFGKEIRCIRKQSLFQLKIENDLFEQLFFIYPQLQPPVILGVDYLQENHVITDLNERCFHSEREGLIRNCHFIQDVVVMGLRKTEKHKRTVSLKIIFT